MGVLQVGGYRRTSRMVDWVFETTYQPRDGAGAVELECGERRGDSNMPEAGSDQCEIIERIIVICRYL
jgi:hypothetical protein